MFAAAKHTALAAVSIALLVAVVVGGGATGAGGPDSEPPTPPQNVHVERATSSTVLLAWGVSVDGVGLDGYFVYEGPAPYRKHDRVAVEETEAEYLLSDLPCGESADVAISAFDEAGNESLKVPLTVSTAACIDRTSPSTPAGFRQQATTQTAVVLAWDPATDDTGVVSYGVHRGVERMASPLEPNVTISGLLCGTTSAYAVDAADAAGNRSALATVYVTTAACERSAPAPTPPAPEPPSSCPSGQFLAQYFANKSLTGSAAKVACESKLDHDWAQSGPGTPVAADGFSARWTGQFNFPAGETTFTATADDGVRVWLDGTVLIDAWKDQSVSTYAGKRTLTAGTHAVKVEYYESGGLAVARLAWTTSSTPPPPPPPAPEPPSSCPSGQFLAQYFANKSLTGSAAKVACESKLDHDWAQSGPGTPVAADGFSARWTGQFNFPAGETTFTATADDGVRVWLDGTVLIDAWKDQSVSTYAGKRTLTAGTHAVKVEYYESGGLAVARLAWTTSSTPPPPPPPAPEPPSSCPSGQFLAQYFANKSLTGSAAKVACESKLDHDWAQSGPGTPVAADGFSARWTGQFNFPAGETTFTATADDGVRVWLDGTVLIDAWKDQSVSTYAGKRTLTAGTHAVKVEYYESGGLAVARLAWTTSSTPPPPPVDTTPPTQPTNLAVSNSNASAVSLSWSPSTDDRGVAGYETYKDSAPAGTTVNPGTTVSGLTCGEAYVFEADAVDAAGNRSPKASVIGSTAACVDSQPPSTPTNVVATSRTATSIALSWTPATDYVGVVGYGLYRAGIQIGTSNSTTGIFSGLACNTNYTLAVDASDAAGNRSPKTTVMVATTTCPDTQAPSAPTGLAASNVTQTGLTLSWGASSDNVSVTGYDVFRNGVVVATVTGTSAVQSGLTCNTAYAFEVVARDAAGNRSNPAQIARSTAACPVAPPTTSGPITITAGGTYVGHWVSNSSAPAVTIQTAQPVVIQDSIIENTAGGHLVSQSSSGAQVTVRRTVFNGIAGGFGRAIRGENYKSWLVENCTINRTGGIYFLTPGSSASITVRKNRMRNVQGDGGSNKRQFLQLNGVSSATILAEWNEIINTFGQSYSEDVFSVFNTSNAVIRNNYVEGGYPATAGAGHQGTGILLADAGGSNNIAHDNQIVGVTNVGIGIAAGSNNTIRNNRVVSDGKTPTGVTLTGANLGIYAYMASGLPMSNNLIYDNLVGWMHSGSPMYRNDIWAPEADNNVAADNDYLYGNYSTPITAADEQAEWPIWLAKLAANSITVGA